MDLRLGRLRGDLILKIVPESETEEETDGSGPDEIDIRDGILESVGWIG